jgi:DNA transformation protein
MGAFFGTHSNALGELVHPPVRFVVITVGQGVRGAEYTSVSDPPRSSPLVWCNVRSMREPDQLTTYLLELLAPIGPIAARRMFGGVGLFHGGTMFGLIAREELYLKVGDANRSAYEAAGEAPFTYDTKHGSHTLGSYWRCPAEVLDDPETFQAWARQAVAAAIVAARAKPKAPRKRGAPP